jgi:hypothetical protein
MRRWGFDCEARAFLWGLIAEKRRARYCALYAKNAGAAVESRECKKMWRAVMREYLWQARASAL